MNRVTRSEINTWFVKLCKVLNKHENIDGIGSWRLSYAPIYGGYIIQELADESGGINNPLVLKRRPAKEMLAALQMACAVIEYQKQKGES